MADANPFELSFKLYLHFGTIYVLRGQKDLIFSSLIYN
jgi:hypothetical protein